MVKVDKIKRSCREAVAPFCALQNTEEGGIMKIIINGGKTIKIFRKVLGLVLMFLVTIAAFSGLEVKSAGLTLEELQAKFPNGAYWNHVV